MSGEEKEEDGSSPKLSLKDADAADNDSTVDTSMEEIEQDSTIDTSVEIIEGGTNRNDVNDTVELETTQNTIDDTDELETTQSTIDDTVELETTQNTIDDTVTLNTTGNTVTLNTTVGTVDLNTTGSTVTLNTTVGTVDLLETSKETVDTRASKKAKSTKVEEVQENTNENLNLDDMIVIDTTGDESAKIEDRASGISAKKKEDLGRFPESPFQDVISLDTSRDTSSQDTKNSADDISAVKKEDLGKFPENPFLKAIISLDTTGDSSSQDTKSSAEELGSSQKLEKEDIQNMIILDTTGESNKEEEIEDDDDDIICIEGVSIDVDGDMGNITHTQNAYPVHEIPSYDSNMAGILSDIEYNMITGNKIQDKPKKCCFNCLGDHNVPDCPEPPNAQRISANRKKTMSNRISNVRYHEDADNKYGQFQPGKISDNLRHALGMRHNELPTHIYRMRYLGYPPGWLKEAEVRQADMKMFDGIGQTVSHPDSEEGEAEPTAVKYNPDKLVSFPGFNVDAPRGIRDDWRQMDFPPMQRNHRKSEFARFMELNKAGAYKKRKLKDESLKSNGNLDTSKQSSSMDIDDSGINVSSEIEFNPPLPEEPMPPLPPEEAPSTTPKRPLDMEEGELEDESESSIGYLEAKRHELLKQLEDSGNLSNDGKVGSVKEEKENTTSSTDIENDTESSTQLNEDSEKSSTQLNEDSENSINSSTETQKTKKVSHHSRSASKGFQLGVPIPESITPFTTLPHYEKWTVDVTDHINFENLPDALGTWDKMKGLMRKVQKRMIELHEDDE